MNHNVEPHKFYIPFPPSAGLYIFVPSGQIYISGVQSGKSSPPTRGDKLKLETQTSPCSIQRKMDSSMVGFLLPWVPLGIIKQAWWWTWTVSRFLTFPMIIRRLIDRLLNPIKLWVTNLPLKILFWNNHFRQSSFCDCQFFQVKWCVSCCCNIYCITQLPTIMHWVWDSRNWHY